MNFSKPSPDSNAKPPGSVGFVRWRPETVTIMACTVQNGCNESPCREGSPRLLKDKTHRPTTHSEIHSFPIANHVCATRWVKCEKIDFGYVLRNTKNSPRGKFHRFLFLLSIKLSDLNFASYVLYITNVMSRDKQ